MTESVYYDDFTGITHYENFFVLRIDEIEDKKTKKIDTTCFVVYDKDDDMFYVYGSRKSPEHPNHCIYQKSFKHFNDLYLFFMVTMDLTNHNVNTTIYHVPYATSEADFDTFKQICKRQNEITGYDNIKLKRTQMFKHLTAIV